MNRYLVMLGLCITLLLPNFAYSKGYALLIGIQDYPEKLGALYGPHNDIALIKNVIQEILDIQDIEVLKDATHTQIEKGIKNLSNNIGNDDFVYIHYSGHGSHYPNRNPEQDIEISDYDQTWIPSKARAGELAGIDDFDILDDEINDWLQPLFNKTQHVIIVSDSCHSGTATRYAEKIVRTVSMDKRTYHPYRSKSPTSNNQGIRIGATEDDKSAFERVINEKYFSFLPFTREQYYGVFTWFWAKALKEYKPLKESSYKDPHYWYTVFDNAYESTKKYNGQHPHLDQPPYLYFVSLELDRKNRCKTVKNYDSFDKLQKDLFEKVMGERVCIKLPNSSQVFHPSPP
ncbi:peptidase C14 caspase catalytic subunit p20, partial [Candidatus Thiomargarita nelsonii]